MPRSIRSPHLQAIFSTGKMLRYKKDATIAATDDNYPPIMLIQRGYIKRYLIANSGALGVQIIYGPQDLFSLTEIYKVLLGQSLYDGPEAYYYDTMSDVELLSLDSRLFVEAVHADTRLYSELFAEAGQHLNTCVHSLENISLGSAYARVTHQILFLVRKFGEVTSEGTKLPIDVTHQDIANMIGSSRETVTTSIIKLRNKGLISNGRQLIVFNLDLLSAEAYA